MADQQVRDLCAIEEVDHALADMQSADQRIVLDGAVDASRYVKANPRLLWVLREPNGGGPWDLRQYFRETLFTYNHWHKTAGLMIRVSHGLLHHCLPWGPWADDARTTADSLRDVAVININKRGGEAVVNWDCLYIATLDFGPIITRQIDALSPDIVILAGTYEVLPGGLRQRLAAFDDSDEKSLKVEDVVFVRAYHTNQRHISHEDYYEAIRQEVLRFGGK